MTYLENSFERRKQKRYRVTLPAIAVIRAKPTLLLGQIQDISTGGLSFTYIQSPFPLRETSEVDIFLLREKISLNSVRFHTVSDSRLPNKNPFSTIMIRRRGIDFDGLLPDHFAWLENLIPIIASPGEGVDPCPTHSADILLRASV